MDLPAFGDNRIFEYARVYSEAYDDAFKFAASIGLSVADCVHFAHDEARRITAEHEPASQ